jgi:hypothetical protein
VKNQGNKLMTFRAFSIGFSAAVLALACGGGDDNNPDKEVPVVGNNPPPRALSTFVRKPATTTRCSLVAPATTAAP